MDNNNYDPLQQPLNPTVVPQNQQPLNPTVIPQNPQPFNPTPPPQEQRPLNPVADTVSAFQGNAWNPQPAPAEQPPMTEAPRPDYGYASAPSDPYGAAYGAVPPAAATPVVQKKKSVLPLILIAVLSLVGIAVVLLITLLNPSVKSVSIENSVKTMYRDGKIELDVKVTPAKAEDKNKVTWDSSDHTIATVSKDGVLTAVGAGKCEITATCGKKSDSFTVEVKSYNEKEELILGDWDCSAFYSDGELTPCYTSIPLVLNDDLTGSMTLSENKYSFTWAYSDKTDDGDPVYLLQDDGSGFPTSKIVLNSEKGWIVLFFVGKDLALVFECD